MSSRWFGVLGRSNPCVFFSLLSYGRLLLSGAYRLDLLGYYSCEEASSTSSICAPEPQRKRPSSATVASSPMLLTCAKRTSRKAPVEPSPIRNCPPRRVFLPLRCRLAAPSQECCFDTSVPDLGEFAVVRNAVLSQVLPMQHCAYPASRQCSQPAPWPPKTESYKSCSRLYSVAGATLASVRPSPRR